MVEKPWLTKDSDKLSGMQRRGSAPSFKIVSAGSASRTGGCGANIPGQLNSRAAALSLAALLFAGFLRFALSATGGAQLRNLTRFLGRRPAPTERSEVAEKSCKLAKDGRSRLLRNINSPYFPATPPGRPGYQNPCLCGLPPGWRRANCPGACPRIPQRPWRRHTCSETPPERPSHPA